MGAIIDFFAGIADAVSAALDFLASIIADTLYVVQLTGEFVTQVPEYLSFLPPPILALAVSMFAVAVIYKILGRE